MQKRILAALLLVFMLATLSFAHAEEFSLRGGVRFGMSPEEIIVIEASNGFHYDMTSTGETLYTHTTNYQLYFEDKINSTLGTLPIMRFEYDFDLAGEQMYQFYYVFKDASAYEYLLAALTAKYGAPTTTSTLSTEKYAESSAKFARSHSRWELTYDDEIVIIDLWDNTFDTCFLAYQGFDTVNFADEQASLDFGL